MIKRTEAIVLKTTSFGDADLIVTYLTRKYGLVRAFAKSPKKIKSKFGSSLEPLTHSHISFFGKEETPLPRLIQSDIIQPFQSLREDFTSLMKIYEMLELCLTFLPEREPNEENYRLLLNTLIKMEENSDQRICRLYYKLKFLDIAGLLPGLDACGRCGRLPGTNRYHSFYISDGSIICSNCLRNGKKPLVFSEGSLKFYKSILKWNYSTIDRIKAPEHLISELLGLINSHINHVIGTKTVYQKHYS